MLNWASSSSALRIRNLDLTLFRRSKKIVFGSLLIPFEEISIFRGGTKIDTSLIRHRNKFTTFGNGKLANFVDDLPLH
jgi:hypothetical protein